MKLKTQHIRVTVGHESYQLHRDGNVTWKTKDSKHGESVVYDEVVHPTKAAAKAIFSCVTNFSKKG